MGGPFFGYLFIQVKRTGTTVFPGRLDKVDFKHDGR